MTNYLHSVEVYSAFGSNYWSKIFLPRPINF
mgnify:CR=1 FL=1